MDVYRAWDRCYVKKEKGRGIKKKKHFHPSDISDVYSRLDPRPRNEKKKMSRIPGLHEVSTDDWQLNIVKTDFEREFVS